MKQNQQTGTFKKAKVTMPGERDPIRAEDIAKVFGS